MAGEQLVEQDPQRVNVAARVDIERAHLRLLRAHVGRGAYEQFEGGEERFVGQSLIGRFRDAKVNHLGHRFAILERDQDVRRFDIAVDNALLVRVLQGMADLDEEVEPLLGREMILVAVVGDLDPPHQFHDEVGPAGVGRARIQNPGDIRMVHEGQRLPLGLEAGDDSLGVHAQLDNLERHSAADGLLLLGHVHRPAAAFPDLLEEFVGTDPVSGLLGERHGQTEGQLGGWDDRLFEEPFGMLVGLEELLNLGAQRGVASAGTIQIGGPPRRASSAPPLRPALP